MPFLALICSSLRKEILKEHSKMEETLFLLSKTNEGYVISQAIIAKALGRTISS